MTKKSIKKDNHKKTTERYRQEKKRLKQRLDMQQKERCFQTQNQFNKQLLLSQRHSNKSTRIIAWVNVFMFIIAVIGMGYTIDSVTSEKEANLPKIEVQITDEKSPYNYGEFNPSSVHKVWLKDWNAPTYSIPIYVEINNRGQVPFQLYNIMFDNRCGSYTGKGLLSIPENQSKLIRTGESIFFSESIYSIFNTTIGENLPCEIDFWIYGGDTEPVEKNIILVKDNIKIEEAKKS